MGYILVKKGRWRSAISRQIYLAGLIDNKPIARIQRYRAVKKQPTTTKPVGLDYGKFTLSVDSSRPISAIGVFFNDG